MQEKIQNRVFSGTQKGSPAKFFGIARQKNRKTHEAAPVSYARKDSKPEFFSNTEGFPYKIFRHCEMKKIENPVRHPPPPPPMQEKIQNRVFSGTQKGSPAKFFGIARQKNRKTREAPPPSYARKFSIPDFFRNTDWFPYKFFRHCDTRKNRKTRDATPTPMQEKIQNQIFFQTQKGSPTKFYGTVR